VAQPLGVSISGTTAVCAGTSAQLSAVVSGGDGNNVYTWSTGDNTAFISPTPTIATTYTVSVTDGCTSNPVTASQTVTVDPLAVAGFSQSITGNLSYAFTDGSSNATSYLWDFGDGNTSTQQNPNHTYAAGGTYTVCLIATNNCGSDTSCTPLTVVANAVAFGNGAVQLWPNPNNGRFNVRVQGLQGGDLRMEVYNVTGQKLLEKNFLAAFETIEENFELVSTKGVYFLKLDDGTNQATLRFVVQ
jgi:PKD repeat protein